MNEDPLFRSNIATYCAPDRVEWKKKHGAEPFEVTAVHPKFLSRARAAISRDQGTIEFKPAVNANVALDEVNEAVSSEAGLPPNHIVYYDPLTDSFWAYPVKE